MRRVEIQRLLDSGKSDEAILDFELGKYGEETLRIPLDSGYQPPGLGAAGGGAARRRRRAGGGGAPLVGRSVARRASPVAAPTRPSLPTTSTNPASTMSWTSSTST